MNCFDCNAASLRSESRSFQQTDLFIGHNTSSYNVSRIFSVSFYTTDLIPKDSKNFTAAKKFYYSFFSCPTNVFIAVYDPKKFCILSKAFIGRILKRETKTILIITHL